MTITSTEVASLRSGFEWIFNDQCQILVPTTTYDALNQPIQTYTTGTAQSCGFDATGGTKRMGADITIQQYDAQVRLASSTIVDKTYLVRVTQRLNVSAGYVPQVFSIENISYGISGQLIGLKLYEY